jgi:hypothetical protein
MPNELKFLSIARNHQMESDLDLEVIRVYIGFEKIYKTIFTLWEFDTTQAFSTKQKLNEIYVFICLTIICGSSDLSQ